MKEAVELGFEAFPSKITVPQTEEAV